MQSRRQFLGRLGAFALAPSLPLDRIEPELILYNANIITIDDRRPRAQAVAIASTRFLVIGAAVIDVESATEVIGLVTAAAFGNWCDVKNMLLTKARRVAVESSKDIPAILDGERANLGRSTQIG